MKEIKLGKFIFGKWQLMSTSPKKDEWKRFAKTDDGDSNRDIFVTLARDIQYTYNKENQSFDKKYNYTIQFSYTLQHLTKSYVYTELARHFKNIDAAQEYADTVITRFDKLSIFY